MGTKFLWVANTGTLADIPVILTRALIPSARELAAANVSSYV